MAVKTENPGGTDGAGRETLTSVASMSGTVYQKVDCVFDNNSNVLLETTSQLDQTPNADRVSRVAYWYDNVNRVTDVEDLGTAGTDRSENPPSSYATAPGRLTHNDYNGAGQLAMVTDPLGNKTEYNRDPLGRVKKEVRAKDTALSQETDYAYTGLDQVDLMTVRVRKWPDGPFDTQVTDYQYGVMLNGMAPSNDQLYAIFYPAVNGVPDTTLTEENERYGYNLLGGQSSASGDDEPGGRVAVKQPAVVAGDRAGRAGRRITGAAQGVAGRAAADVAGVGERAAGGEADRAAADERKRWPAVRRRRLNRQDRQAAGAGEYAAGRGPAAKDVNVL
jgi:YD repeat-containing protein